MVLSPQFAPSFSYQTSILKRSFSTRAQYGICCAFAAKKRSVAARAAIETGYPDTILHSGETFAVDHVGRNTVDSKISGSLLGAEPGVETLVQQTRDSLLGRFKTIVSKLEARVDRPEGSGMSACEVALDLAGGVRIYGRHRDREPERAVYKAFARAASALRSHLGKRRRLAVARRTPIMQV
jgi:hypothetical protein